MHIFDIPETRNIGNIDDFGGSKAKKHDIYSVGLPLVAKITVFTLLPQAEQKYWYLRNFRCVVKCRFYKNNKSAILYDIIVFRPQIKESKNGSRTAILVPMARHHNLS